MKLRQIAFGQVLVDVHTDVTWSDDYLRLWLLAASVQINRENRLFSWDNVRSIRFSLGRILSISTR